MEQFSSRGYIESNLEALYREQIQRRNKDITILVVGKPGDGKSSLTLWMAKYLADTFEPVTFDFTHIGFTHDGWASKAKNLKRQAVEWHDEGRDSFYRRKAMTNNNTEAMNILNQYRFLNHIRFINFQNIADIELDLLYNNMAQGIMRCVKQGWMHFHSQQTMQEINVHKKKRKVNWPRPDFRDGYPDPAERMPELWAKIEEANEEALQDKDEEEDDRKFVSAGDAADELGVSTETIRRWVDDDRIEAYRVGPQKHLRIPQDEVDRMITPAN